MGRLLLVPVLVLGLTSPAGAVTAYGAGIVAYIHDNPKALTEGYLLSLAAGGQLANIIPNYCSSLRLDEFAIEKRLPVWNAIIRKDSIGLPHTVLNFSVDTGIYDFNSHNLPLTDTAGGFYIRVGDALDAGTICNVPPYKRIQDLPDTVVYDVPAGIVPTSIGVSEGIAREVVDAKRSVSVKIGVVVTACRFQQGQFADDSIYVAKVRSLWIQISGAGHVIYKRHFT